MYIPDEFIDLWSNALAITSTDAPSFAKRVPRVYLNRLALIRIGPLLLDDPMLNLVVNLFSLFEMKEFFICKKSVVMMVSKLWPVSINTYCLMSMSIGNSFFK